MGNPEKSGPSTHPDSRARRRDLRHGHVEVEDAALHGGPGRLDADLVKRHPALLPLTDDTQRGEGRSQSGQGVVRWGGAGQCNAKVIVTEQVADASRCTTQPRLHAEKDAQ